MGEIKLCECGCGNPAPIAKYTSRRCGWVKDQPKRFILGHASLGRRWLTGKRSHNFQDLTSQVFGRLTVKEYSGKNKFRNAIWLCSCVCGEVKPFLAGSLVGGNAQSCGCLHRELTAEIGKCWGKVANLSHGHARRYKRSPTILSWESMKQRCTNPKNPSYPQYGGVGVTVCERWNSFENFLADMGERLPNTTLGRYCDMTNYEPDGCAWMTPAEQKLAQMNKRALLKWAQTA